MKIFNYILTGLVSIALLACTGNNNQQVQPVDTQNQMAAPTDSNMSQAPTQAMPTNAQSLPEPVNAFVKQYFPNATIAFVEPDHEHGGLQHDVTLNDGTELDFDSNHQWDKVDCKVKPVPAALVPEVIASYVNANYQGVAITKIDHEPYGYEIELSNGLELRFSQYGQFMSIDD